MAEEPAGRDRIRCYEIELFTYDDLDGTGTSQR